MTNPPFAIGSVIIALLTGFIMIILTRSSFAGGIASAIIAMIAVSNACDFGVPHQLHVDLAVSVVFGSSVTSAAFSLTRLLRYPPSLPKTDTTDLAINRAAPVTFDDLGQRSRILPGKDEPA